MKKAFLDQLFLGFLLLVAIVTFVATVVDETQTRNRINDLKDIARSSSHAMAEYYALQVDMCEAQDINNDLLRQTKLGTYLLDNNLIYYLWSDTTGDGQPDQVQTNINEQDFDTFWYRFLNRDSFSVGPFAESENIQMPVTVNISFGSEGADYKNMAGTYELDQNGCITNTQLILENSERAGLQAGDKLGSQITSPPTYLFLISDGYNEFYNNTTHQGPSLNDNIEVNHCFSDATSSNSNPTVKMNGVTKNDARMFFEHDNLNGDGNYAHFQIIPKSIWDKYIDFINKLNGNAKDKYQQFIAQADLLNADNDPTNDINYTTDPNNEYYYAMEDINGGGDQDFNDLVLDSTRVIIPNQLNNYIVNDDGSILLQCGANENPVVTINGCPITIDEDTTSVNDITWSATDLDGAIMSTSASAENGTVTVNNNGTLTYTPLSNYYGNDLITFSATDNAGEVGFGYCSVVVAEVNDPPQISGNPTTSVAVGANYSFTPTATDEDGDVLSFSAQNLPSWLSINSNTGELSGTPELADAGIHSNIIITVSDNRGGEDSLEPFSIQVLEDPVVLVTPIPDGTVYEKSTYSIDYSNYFSSNSPLTYTLTYSFNGTTDTITLEGSIFTKEIPDLMAGRIFVLNVTASNGSSSASDSYKVDILDRTSCNGPFEINFNQNDGGFSNGNRDGKSYRIEGGTNYAASKNFDFGFYCKDTTVQIKYTFKTSGNWEDNDTFKLLVNTRYIDEYTEIHHQQENWIDITTSGKTDSSGNLTLYFYADTSRNNERVWIDDIIVGKE